MNKIISIKVQRVLSYIPFANTIVLFIWWHNCRVIGVDQKTFFKSLCVIWAVTIPIAVLQIVLVNTFSVYPGIVTIINYVAGYSIPFSMAKALIRFQEKMHGQTEKK